MPLRIVFIAVLSEAVLIAAAYLTMKFRRIEKRGFEMLPPDEKPREENRNA